MMALLKVYSP